MKLGLTEGESINGGMDLRLSGGLERIQLSSRLVHVYLDNARYRCVKMPDLFWSGRTAMCSLIERLLSVMHPHVVRNWFDLDCRQSPRRSISSSTGMSLEREKITDAIIGNFRIITRDQRREFG